MLSPADLPSIVAAIKKFRGVVADSPIGIYGAEARAARSKLLAAAELLIAALHPSDDLTIRVNLEPYPTGEPRFSLYNSNPDFLNLPLAMSPVEEVWDRLVELVNANDFGLTDRSKRKWVVLLDETLAKLDGPATTERHADPIIVALGENQYQLDGSRAVTASPSEDIVLQAYLDNPRGKWKAASSLDTAELERRTKLTDPGAIVRRLQKGSLGTAIDCPGKKNKGKGYGIRITSKMPPK